MSFLFSSGASKSANKQYSYECKVPAKEGEGKPRRSLFVGDGNLLRTFDDSVLTLWDNFKKGCIIAGDGPLFGTRSKVNGVAGEYVWMSYNQAMKRVLNIGSGIMKVGLQKGSMVGLYSINRPEWVLAEQACNGYGMVSVPLYDTLGDEAIEYIITQTGVAIIFCTADKATNIIKLASKIPTIKTIVLMDGNNEDIAQKGSAAGITVYSQESFEKLGLDNPAEPMPSASTELATICYTSGTTGLPKGVMLSHINLVSDASSILFLGANGEGVDISPNDVHISYLPLAHMFERVVMTFMIGNGAQIGFYQGDTNKLLDDISTLKPTFFPSVPRLLNRIYDKVLSGVDAKGGVSKFLFETAYNAKKEYLRQGYLTHWLWDRLVFGKVKERLGGRVRFILTGSAPISPDVMDFLRICFSCEVYEGYGQTETSAGATLTSRGDYTAGHVGVPLPCCEVKLVDVPEMNYTSQDKPFPRGEVCFRGINVTSGYYKDEKKTNEDIDADGWLHSGDIGLWDAQGRLRLIDRKKNIFKLAQGEYVAPEKIENVYQKAKFVAQAYVHGDSLKAYLVGIIVPDEEVLLPWCKENGIAGSKLADVINDPRVNKVIFDDMIKTGKASGLKGFEQVKRIALSATPFSVDNEILTPTFKLKRPQAKRAYLEQINAMIAAVDKDEEEAKKKAAGKD